MHEHLSELSDGRHESIAAFTTIWEPRRGPGSPSTTPDRVEPHNRALRAAARATDSSTHAPGREAGRAVAQTCAFVGIVAGFWHVLWIARAALLATATVAVGVHPAGYTRLEQDKEVALRHAEEPSEAES